MRSKLDDQFNKGHGLIDRIREDELGLLTDAQDSRKLTVFNHWRGLAQAEQLVRSEYTGRFLFELLQNANDAILDWFEQHPGEQRKETHRVRLELTHQSLLVANCGLPCGENNIRALCQFGDTTKSASKRIGHKGIGFKSVLEITEEPEVYSDCYAFGFDRQEFQASVRQRVPAELKKVCQVPVLLAPFRRCVSWLPRCDRERIEWLFEQDFVTVIRLPFKDATNVERIEERMRSDLAPEILLFLSAIDQLEIVYPSGEDIAYWRVTPPRRAGDHSYRVELHSDESGTAQVHSQWLVLDPDEVLIENRDLLVDLGESWQEVEAVRFAVGFPLDQEGKLSIGDEEQRFHVYFPTEEFSGLRFLVHGDFYVASARRDIRRNAFNDWLCEEIVMYLAATGIEELKKWLPGEPEIVDILAPVGEPRRDFAKYFLDNYLSCLSASPFVPLTGGQYKPPSLVRFAPEKADPSLFRRYFPPSRLRGEERWAFPKLEVEERERARDSQGRPFLLREELGTCTVTIEDVANVLVDGPPVPVEECSEVFAFLSKWWDSLDWSSRPRFTSLMRTCRIVPTQSGWKRPNEGRLFQADLRQEEDIAIPEGFEFELVAIQAYGPDRSYRSVQAEFLRKLGVSDYQRREILRRAILPVLRSPERFEALVSQYPSSVYEAYRFLKTYYEREIGTTEIEADLLAVPVPAKGSEGASGLNWRPAGEVYFSGYWTGTDALEKIYGCFDDIYFLGKIEGLGELDDEAKRSWYGFFHWLGVAHLPRILEDSGKYEWYDVVRRDHPFNERPFWDSYVNALTEAFECGNPDKPHHGKSRIMRRNWALDHFEQVVHRGDVEQLTAFFELLGSSWENYRGHLSISLRCSYTSTGCDVKSAPSYLGYCLRQSEWVPAIVWGQPSSLLLKPRDIWVLGDDVPPEVQRLVPALPSEFRDEAYQAIQADLMKSEPQFEDYLRLLTSLPKWYDLERRDLGESELKRWQRAIGAVFYWIGQALQNGLVRDQNAPACPVGLEVLAFRGKVPKYVSVRCPELVYADDSLLARVWANDLWYLKVNDDWVRLREWLGVPNLSDRVHVECRMSPDLPNETRVTIERYDAALPFFLAVVKDAQPSNFGTVSGRLHRLNLHVVEELAVRQSIPDLDIAPKELKERVHLRSRDEPGQRRHLLRAGDLYITRDAMDNPDLLGNYIANYIEILRLGDAFVVLYERQDNAARWRYLDSKGITREFFEEVLEELQESGDELGVPPGLKELDRTFQEKVAEIAILQPPPVLTPPPSNPLSRGEFESTPAAGRLAGDEATERDFPDLNLEQVGEVENYDGEYIRTPLRTGGSEGGARVYHYHPPSEKVRIEVGRRGERWAYQAERQRLRQLGLDPDELERKGQLVWESDRNPTAHYDILSVDRRSSSLIPIYIEVKSTVGADRTAEWSISEFRLAASVGERYWLYWVFNAERANPTGPICLRDPVKLWRDGKLALDFRQLAITLPNT